MSSRHALEMLRLDQQPGSRLPPAWVIPHSIKTVTRQAKPPSTSAGPGPVIATFGFVGKDKGSEVLIDAVSMLPDSLNAKLLFVGSADAVSADEVFTRAAERGIGDSVAITGFVSEDQWLEHIWGAACAVQLRPHSHGESSGSVADCISAGLPVITNIASCEEIERDAVMYVPADISAGALRDALLTLSAGGLAWTRIHEGALRYAAANSFDAAAGKITGAVMQVARLPRNGIIETLS